MGVAVFLLALLTATTVAHAQWIRLNATSETTPGRLRAASGTYTTALDSFVLFGGLDDQGSFTNALRVYSFDLESWTLFPSSSSSPPGREWATLTLLDEPTATSARFILLGGASFATSTWTNHSDVWLLELEVAAAAEFTPTWTELSRNAASLITGPGGISLHQTVNRRGKLYAFAGNRFSRYTGYYDDYSAVDGLWELDASPPEYTWRAVSKPVPNTTATQLGIPYAWPTARFGFGMGLYLAPSLAAADDDDALLVYSGRTTGFDEIPDLWAFSFATEQWRLVNAKASFPGKVSLGENNVMDRAHNAMYVHSEDGSVTSFGGVAKVLRTPRATRYAAFNQLLLSKYNPSSSSAAPQVACTERDVLWCSVNYTSTAAAEPPARYDFAWAVRPTSGDLIVYGGRSFSAVTGAEISLGDFWLLDRQQLLAMPLTVAIEPRATTGSAGGDDGAFTRVLDMTTIIYFLAAMLLVISSFMFVLYMVRKRRMAAGGGQVYFAAQQARQNIQPVGARPEVVAALPIKPYSEMHDEEAAHGTCAICFDAFELTTNVRELRCAHFFHPQCVDEWLTKNNNCPMCKAVVDVEAEAERFRLGSATGAAMAAMGGGGGMVIAMPPQVADIPAAPAEAAAAAPVAEDRLEVVEMTPQPPATPTTATPPAAAAQPL